MSSSAVKSFPRARSSSSSTPTPNAWCAKACPTSSTRWRRAPWKKGCACEKHGGTVMLITMGTSDVTIGIRNALAMGAASAVHILDDAVAGSDTLATAKLLAAAIKKQPFDLVLCATESSDSYSGIVPGQIAHFLGIPPLTFAKEITVDGNKIAIKRQAKPATMLSSRRCRRWWRAAAVSTNRAIRSSRASWRAKKKEIKVYTARSRFVAGPSGGKRRARKSSDHRPAAEAASRQSGDRRRRRRQADRGLSC